MEEKFLVPLRVERVPDDTRPENFLKGEVINISASVVQLNEDQEPRLTLPKDVTTNGSMSKPVLRRFFNFGRS